MIRSRFIPSDLSKHAWKLILVAASLLYMSLWPRHYVGFYNDDAVYVLSAKSLLSGHYVSLNLPGHPPANLYPPGFPLVVAPFVKMFEPHWSSLKWIPFVLTLLSCVLLWRLFEGWLDVPRRLALLGLYAFNPMTANFAGFLMSEPCFVFSLLVIFSLLRKLFTREAPWDAWLLGLFIGWSVLIRTEAIVLIPSILLGLIYMRRWRVVRIVSLMAILPWGLWTLRGIFAAHAPSAYLSGWAGMLPYLTGEVDSFRHLGIHLLSVWSIFLTQNVMGVTFNPQAVLAPWALVLSSVMLVFLGIGVCSFAKRSRSSPGGEGWMLSVTVFCFLYMLIHSVWLSVEIRYMLPLVPFALAACLQGFDALRLRKPAPKGAFLAGLLIGFFYMRQDVMACMEVRRGEIERLPKKTLDWIQAHVPPNTMILALEPAVITLYTGRFATVDVMARDHEEFHYRLLEKEIRYILLRPATFHSIAIPFQDPNRLWEVRRRWINSQPHVYRPVFSSTEEARSMFEVIQSSSFQEAYRLYLSSIEDFERADWEAGFAKLDRAAVKDPSLISPLNGYAIGCLLSGRHLDRGVTKLQKALVLQPEHPLLLLNLARLSKKMGNERMAKTFYAKALSAIEKTGEFQRLGSLIDQEQRF